MKIGLFGVDRVPAKVMGHRCSRSAFVEIGPHPQRFALKLHSDKVKGNDHEKVPREQSLELAERAGAA